MSTLQSSIQLKNRSATGPKKVAPEQGAENGPVSEGGRHQVNNTVRGNVRVNNQAGSARVEKTTNRF